MKKYFYYLSIIIIIITSFSCKENFSPKTNFKDEYVLTCIINANDKGDKISQFATISKLYNVDGLDPYSNNTDPAIKNAEVTIKHNYKEYKMEYVAIPRSDTSRYKTPGVYYKSPDIAMYAGDKFWITAKLPNGKVLNAYTHLPRFFTPEFSYPFHSGITTNIDKFLWGKEWKISWSSHDNDLYFPKLTLNYEKIVNGNTKAYSKEIPMKYINRDGKTEAVYPTYIAGESISFAYDAIDSTMSQISAGDTAKSNYKITSITLQMIEFDTNLSNYYSSTHGYLDNYSIRLDESIYSNIVGGIGIFGSYIKSTQNFNVNKLYVQSFGYTSN